MTSTGEKISPVDIESALETLPLFRQAYAVGDGMPYIAVLISLDPTLWEKFAADQGVDPKDPESLHAPVVRKKYLKWSRKPVELSRHTQFLKTLRSLWTSGRLITGFSRRP